MTSAPRCLLDARSLLLTHLGPHGLASAEVGIVGDAAHAGGYHCGKDRVLSEDYSVVESSRDRTGLTSDAAALDMGDFAYGKHNLRTFSLWCVQQCAAGAADTRDIREVIYSPDGSTVRRWDRLGRRSTGDSSHLWHTHFSFFRDSIKAGRGPASLFRRYLTEIGLIKIQPPEDTVTPAEFLSIIRDPKVAAELSRLPWAFAPATDSPTKLTAHAIVLNGHTSTLSALAARAALTGEDVAENLLPSILAALTPEAIADALPDEIVSDVADELARRLGNRLDV